MADTRIQLEVEDWVRRNWMPTHFGRDFRTPRFCSWRPARFPSPLQLYGAC